MKKETDTTSNSYKKDARAAVDKVMETAKQGTLKVDDIKKNIEELPDFLNTAMATIKELSSISKEAKGSQASTVDAINIAQHKAYDTLAELSKHVHSEAAKMEIARMLHAAFMELVAALKEMNNDNNRTFREIAYNAAKTAGAAIGIGTILAASVWATKNLRK